jgi:hypothetical protein
MNIGYRNIKPILIILSTLMSHSMISQNIQNDITVLSALNARFIKNFVTQNVSSHDEIIDQDFICIQGNGAIVNRQDYLRDWATDYDKSGCIAFTYQDEVIRIFNDIALVRSKTNATRIIDGKTIISHTIYTDTYQKTNGHWKCIQVQITPIR